MQGTFKIKAVDEMGATLTLSATLKEFRAVAHHIQAAWIDKGLATPWPVSDVLRQINALVRDAEKSFCSESQPKPDGAA